VRPASALSPARDGWSAGSGHWDSHRFYLQAGAGSELAQSAVLAPHPDLDSPVPGLSWSINQIVAHYPPPTSQGSGSN
jgi:hypothetical protein